MIGLQYVCSKIVTLQKQNNIVGHKLPSPKQLSTPIPLDSFDTPMDAQMDGWQNEEVSINNPGVP